MLLFGCAFFAQTKSLRFNRVDDRIAPRRASVIFVSIARNNWRGNLPSSADILRFF
jgi:hypothetical protein